MKISLPNNQKKCIAVTLLNLFILVSIVYSNTLNTNVISNKIQFGDSVKYDFLNHRFRYDDPSKVKMRDSTLTNIYNGKNNGVFISVKTKLFYSQNGFKNLPSYISIIVSQNGNFYERSWMPHVAKVQMMDKKGIKRDIFMGFSSDISVIIKKPANSNYAHSNHPLFTNSGWIALYNPWSHGPNNNITCRDDEVLRVRYGDSWNDYQNDTFVLDKLDFSGTDTIYRQENRGAFAGQNLKYIKFTNVVNDESIINSFEYVLQIMYLAEQTAGQYTPDYIRYQSAEGEKIRQMIIRNYYNE